LNIDSSPCPVLVLGMGNILLEDEGLGIRALEILEQRYDFPEGVDRLDGGTTGMGLLDVISGRQHLLVLDAMQTGDPPGTLVRLAGDEVPVYFGMRISPHQLGLSDVLATLELSGERPADVTVLGLEQAGLSAAGQTWPDSVLKALEKLNNGISFLGVHHPDTLG